MDKLYQKTLNNYMNDAWEDLQTELFVLNHKISQEDFMDFLEKSYIFSMFFRGCTQLESHTYQSILGIKENAYVMLLDFISMKNDAEIEQTEITLNIHRYIKNILKDKIRNYHIGPLISNRICILISFPSEELSKDPKADSINLSKYILEKMEKEFSLTASIGIGYIKSLNSIYNSYTEALSCLHLRKPGQILHIQDYEESNTFLNIDYSETEKHMLDALRLRKVEAYDYFGILMNQIKRLSDDAIRNKILELLVLSIHAIRMDDTDFTNCFRYLEYMKEMNQLKENELIEWAYKKFIYITGYVKPLNSIDYTNKIVQTTKEYLEAHYAEDISLEDMAAQVNISPQYFSKLIKKTTGFNFIDWLSILRVKKAKELLTDPSLTVKEVCFMVGYKDPNYFSRIFKKRIGLTPSEFVKKNTL